MNYKTTFAILLGPCLLFLAVFFVFGMKFVFFIASMASLITSSVIVSAPTRPEGKKKN